MYEIIFYYDKQIKTFKGTLEHALDLVRDYELKIISYKKIPERKGKEK